MWNAQNCKIMKRTDCHRYALVKTNNGIDRKGQICYTMADFLNLKPYVLSVILNT
jgi:hypothetical protein